MVRASPASREHQVNKNMEAEIIQGWGNEGKVCDPIMSPWKSLEARANDRQAVQDMILLPGSHVALGLIFMEYSVSKTLRRTAAGPDVQ